MTYCSPLVDLMYFGERALLVPPPSPQHEDTCFIKETGSGNMTLIGGNGLTGVGTKSVAPAKSKGKACHNVRPHPPGA
jgi:hypothetical protein